MLLRSLMREFHASARRVTIIADVTDLSFQNNHDKFFTRKALPGSLHERLPQSPSDSQSASPRV
ncbi:MAG: hypothetical protein PVJ56_19145, partial [Desulfobacterales bacterium]